MGVFLFAGLAILLYLVFADKRRVRAYFPVIMTGVFLRFLEQFFLIDFFEIWVIPGPRWMNLWIPVTADVTVWPVACFLFIQYIPARFRLLYGLFWSVVMTCYVQALLWLNVLATTHWKLWMSLLFISSYFLVIYAVWRWLAKFQKEGEVRT